MVMMDIQRDEASVVDLTTDGYLELNMFNILPRRSVSHTGWILPARNYCRLKSEVIFGVDWHIVNFCNMYFKTH